MAVDGWYGAAQTRQTWADTNGASSDEIGEEIDVVYTHFFDPREPRGPGKSAAASSCLVSALIRRLVLEVLPNKAGAIPNSG